MAGESRKGGSAVSGAVGLVDIAGPLSKRSWFWGDGYDAIESRFAAALSDPEVGSVLLRMDSPGGEVAGLEEAVARMAAAKKRSGKRVVGYVDEFAASAAYWILASLADEIIVPPSAEVGSIGVIAAWVDASKAYEDAGLRVHVHRAPEGKAPGMSFAPLAELADERMAEGVRDAESRFAAAMAKARGLSKREIRAFDAATFRGAKAVEAGLADRVGSLETAIKAARSAARKTKMAQDIRTKLGLDDDATDEQVHEALDLLHRQAAVGKALGGPLVAMTRKTAPEEMIAQVGAWQTSHAKAEEERAALAAERAQLEDAEKVKLVTALVAAGWEAPATAWARDGEGMPQVGVPSEMFASMSIGALRTRAETLLAQPRGVAEKQPAPPGDSELSDRQRALCKERGIDPQDFLRARASIRVVK